MASEGRLGGRCGSGCSGSVSGFFGDKFADDGADLTGVGFLADDDDEGPPDDGFGRVETFGFFGAAEE